MSVSGFLHFAANCAGSRATEEEGGRRVAEMCFLENVMHQSVETAVEGLPAPTCFAQSIIQTGRAVLDEPTDGLDPNQKHECGPSSGAWGKEGDSFSTHILEEVEAVCSRA